MSKDQSKEQRKVWGWLIVVTGVIVSWLIYHLAAGTKSPFQIVVILHYIGLALGLIALVGAVIFYIKNSSSK